MPAVVAEALAAHVARFGTGPEGLVFTNSGGRPIRRNAFGDTWRRAAEAVELREGVTFHDLRHFYAPLLIARMLREGGAAPPGHQSAMETLDSYSHLWPDSDDETREAVDAVLGAVAVG